MDSVKDTKKMSTFDAVMIAEGVYDGDSDQQREAWQMLVDTGLAWSLQGWFGREATRLIEAGVIEPFPRPS